MYSSGSQRHLPLDYLHEGGCQHPVLRRLYDVVHGDTTRELSPMVLQRHSQARTDVSFFQTPSRKQRKLIPFRSIAFIRVSPASNRAAVALTLGTTRY
jgi:hypothetical protein